MKQMHCIYRIHSYLVSLMIIQYKSGEIITVLSSAINSNFETQYWFIQQKNEFQKG